MGKNKTKVTGFRIEDESILEKLNIIAKENCRTRNKEVEYALKHGNIKISMLKNDGKIDTVNM